MIPLDGRGTVRMHDLHMLQLELVERGPHGYSVGKQHCGGKGAGREQIAPTVQAIATTVAATIQPPIATSAAASSIQAPM